jgi:ribosomal-protein-alanine N-acetyltransferase
VAELDGEIIGYAGVWIILDEGHVTNIAVHPKYQRRGIGRQLMEAITAFAAGRGAVRMTLEVRVSNFVAQDLYKQLGYEICGVRKGYYQDTKEDAYIMWKDLRLDEKWIDAGN